MSKKLRIWVWIFSICVISFFICVISVFAQEQLTITTYYPSPYGSYRELRAQRMAIGDTYYSSNYCWPPDTCANQINADADLVVEGTVAIGTANPLPPVWGGLQVSKAGTSDIGVYAVSWGNSGVWGQSTNSSGVYGYSSNNFGVYGNSANSSGVYGYSTSTTWPGVYGYNPNSAGVYGYSNSWSNPGVYGYNPGGNGVVGVSDNSGASGVYGYNATGIGIAGRTVSGVAGYFDGNVVITPGRTIQLDGGGTVNSNGRVHIQSGSGEPLFLNPWAGAGNVYVGGGGGPGTLEVTGNAIVRGTRLYLTGTDGAGYHWIMAGGGQEGVHNALGFVPGRGWVINNWPRTVLAGLSAGDHWIMAGGVQEGVHNALSFTPSVFGMYLGNNWFLQGRLINTSSKRNKTHIEPIPLSEYSSFLQKLKSLQVVRYHLKTEDPSKKKHIGIISEDAPEEIVNEDKTGIGVSEYMGFLIAALKGQQLEIEDLKVQITQLERKIKRRE